ncbi:MAG: 30S ribosomal protein S15 [Candidatus Aenigmarchaeota archaeon]|nr:30S ribosomal protein S15 [Candidatus Aenigmarchaeota archaeon]
MAKMHSRKKGRSGSKKPATPAKWVALSDKEVERLVIKFRKEGMEAAKIGFLLRDQYGIPSVRDITSKTITQIFQENSLVSKIPEDLLSLYERAVNLRDHMGKNKKDYTSKHGLELLESKIRRLIKYYVKNKKLPAGFKYEPDKAKLLVETTKQ